MPFPTPALLGSASSQGPHRPVNADAHAHHKYNDRLAIAVVDGTGSTPEVAAFATIAAETAVRVAARRTPVWAVAAAAELCADPRVDFPQPDGAIIVATAELSGNWLIAWAGDCVAYTYDHEIVRRVSTPHNHGELLRHQGVPEQEARAHDHELYHSVARVPVRGISAVETDSPVLIISSDGLRLTPEELADVLTRHDDDLPTCAQELVTSARKHTADDITVVIAVHPFVQSSP